MHSSLFEMNPFILGCILEEKKKELNTYPSFDSKNFIFFSNLIEIGRRHTIEMNQIMINLKK